MINKFLMVTVSVLSLQSACYAGKNDVESIVSSPSKVLQSQVVITAADLADSSAPKKSSAASKFKSFLAGCFACLKTTEKVVGGANDLTREGLDIADQIDVMTGNKQQENINKVIGIADAAVTINSIVGSKVKSATKL